MSTTESSGDVLIRKLKLLVSEVPKSANSQGLSLSSNSHCCGSILFLLLLLVPSVFAPQWLRSRSRFSLTEHIPAAAVQQRHHRCILCKCFFLVNAARFLWKLQSWHGKQHRTNSSSLVNHSVDWYKFLNVYVTLCINNSEILLSLWLFPTFLNWFLWTLPLSLFIFGSKLVLAHSEQNLFQILNISHSSFLLPNIQPGPKQRLTLWAVSTLQFKCVWCFLLGLLMQPMESTQHVSQPERWGWFCFLSFDLTWVL